MLCLVVQLCLTLCDPMDCSLPGSSVHRDSPGKNTAVGFHALLQCLFPIQGSNLGLPHCRQILYRPSHQGSPRILEWVTYPFSPGELHTTRIILRCPELQEDSLPAELPGKHPSVFTAIQIIHLMTFLSFCLHATLPFQEDKRNTTEASTERKCNPNRRNAIRRK